MRIKTTPTNDREALDIFIDHNLRMMVLSGALAAAASAQHGQWCVQFAGGDPLLVSHDQAMMLAYGFRLGTTHYHAYRVQQRELAVLMAEDEAEESAE